MTTARLIGALIDGDHRGEVAAQTQQAQNGISWHVQAAQPDSDESRGAKFPTVLRKEVSLTFRELEPRDGLATAVGPSQECSVRGYPFSASVPERPRKTKMARLSALLSSEVSDPTSLPSRLLGTAVNLSTFIRHGERRPLWVLGWMGSLKIGAGVGSVVKGHTTIESLASNRSSWTMTAGRGARIRRTACDGPDWDPAVARFDSYARSPVPQTLLAAIWLQCARVLTEHPTFKVLSAASNGSLSRLAQVRCRCRGSTVGLGWCRAGHEAAPDRDRGGGAGGVRDPMTGRVSLPFSF
ncbi:MAG TPA: hypothetical protein VFO87_02570 [Nitrospira sp.]|nr:hypothetical protein [Nitrospira sp.]